MVSTDTVVGVALSPLDDGGSPNSLLAFFGYYFSGKALGYHVTVQWKLAPHAVSNDTAGNPHFRPLRMKVLPLYLTFSDTTLAFYYSVRKVGI